MKYIKDKSLILGKKETQIKENLDAIFDYIYYQIPLNHDKMVNLYKDVNVPISFDDTPDYDYYRDKLKFVPCDETDDKYIYKFKDEVDLESFDINPIIISEIHGFLMKYSPKKLKIGNYTDLKVSNYHGVNKDARGIRYLDWRLYFWEEYNISNDNGITFHDLIIAAYKVKSHKFENNYEMYCSIKNIHNSDNKLCIDLKFDHGS